MGPENAHFSHFEPRKRGSEPRFRVSKCAGISRVKTNFYLCVVREARKIWTFCVGFGVG